MRSLVSAGALVLASCATHPPAALPPTAFAGALVSTAANPSTGVDLYADLIGSWSVDVTDFSDDGSTHRDTGEWHFSRILDGRGVQDVWISPPRSARGPSYTPGAFDRFGTSIRTPLAGGETWKVIWLNPVHNVEVQLIGRRAGNQIVQETEQPGGARYRWVFDELDEHHFHWIGERSQDGGKTWRRVQEMAGRRTTAPSSSSVASQSPAPSPTSSSVAASSPPPSPLPAHAVPAAFSPGDATAMVRALQATAPHPSVARGASTFDWLQGSWDLECDLWPPGGQHKHTAGEWYFGWIVDGRMMQDALYFFPPGKPEQRKGGTSLRMYDPEHDEWTVVWFAPSGNGSMISLKGGKVGDRIVLRGTDSDGALLRWTFDAIRADAFHWLGERSTDAGKTWGVEQEMHLRRRR